MVLQVINFNKEWIAFTFVWSNELLPNPLKDVWFDESSAPFEGRLALNKFFAMSNDDTTV
jgi:hypothetical protein